MSKDEIIEISKDFTEPEEQRFRKMLQQGGKISIQGKKFEIIKDLKDYARNSKGEYEAQQLNLIETKTGNEAFRRHTMVDL